MRKIENLNLVKWGAFRIGYDRHHKNLTTAFFFCLWQMFFFLYLLNFSRSVTAEKRSYRITNYWKRNGRNLTNLFSLRPNKKSGQYDFITPTLYANSRSRQQNLNFIHHQIWSGQGSFMRPVCRAIYDPKLHPLYVEKSHFLLSLKAQKLILNPNIKKCNFIYIYIYYKLVPKVSLKKDSVQSMWERKKKFLFARSGRMQCETHCISQDGRNNHFFPVHPLSTKKFKRT